MLLDVGGKAQPEKEILGKQCSHYIIISRDRQHIQGWYDLRYSTLNWLAIVHSR